MRKSGGHFWQKQGILDILEVAGIYGVASISSEPYLWVIPIGTGYYLYPFGTLLYRIMNSICKNPGKSLKSWRPLPGTGFGSLKLESIYCVRSCCSPEADIDAAVAALEYFCSKTRLFPCLRQSGCCYGWNCMLLLSHGFSTGSGGGGWTHKRNFPDSNQLHSFGT